MEHGAKNIVSVIGYSSVRGKRSPAADITYYFNVVANVYAIYYI
jgi:hypothetical protein